ncbi:outer membrane lipoprotein carrier protein LolA [Candidatus Sumerlaeota bacterium]|nr:outer membrane lipoprotein carrier protein LolA [Candidatus Sumerlaeota bacterium]
MKKITAKLATMMVAAAFIAMPCLLKAETPEELLKRMKPKSEALKSWEMKMENSMKSQFMETKGTISTIAKRDGDTVKSYSEMTSETKMQGLPEPQKSASKMVSDGSTLWVEMKMGDKVTVMKSPYKVDPTSVEAMADLLKEGKWEVKPQETIDGEACSVLSGTTGQPPQQITTTYWMSDKTGHPVKIVVSGGPMGENVTKVTSFKENPAIDDSKFAYTPPAGAEVMDTSALGRRPDAMAPKSAAPK